jgi:7-carboxy-7-deazaguanine synthase
VVITGGEPMLQLDDALIAALHARAFEIAVETNGTLPAPAGIDWICVSPKAGTEVIQRSGDELKLVWPQDGIDPAALLGWDFRHFLIQPMDCAEAEAARAAAIALVMADPRWRLSLQTHKLLGLP